MIFSPPWRWFACGVEHFLAFEMSLDRVLNERQYTRGLSSARNYPSYLRRTCPIVRAACFNSCPCALDNLKCDLCVEKAWETRLERRSPGCLVARAMTVRKVVTIPQQLIVPLTWPFLRVEGVFCCVCVCVCVCMW